MHRQLRTFGVRVALIWAVFAAGSLSSEAGTLLTINTNMGNIQVELFDGVTEGTVDNFLSYVTNGSFSNTVIHRSSVANRVIQGGGYNTSFNPIATNAPIPLDYTVHHVRGTLGMARTSSPNSATSQWFINTADNTDFWKPKPGSDGYAAFGWVLTGMDVVDAIHALPVYFGEVPLKDFTGTSLNQATNANKVIINSISITGENNSFQNPVFEVDTNNDGNLNSQDALLIINDLLTVGAGHNASADYITTNYKYFDPNGDGRVNSKDLLMVFNAILAENAAAALAAEPMAAEPMAAPLAVPEPATWGLLLTALAALGVVGARRRFGRNR